MRKHFLSISILAFILISCNKDEQNKEISQGNYPVKEYYLERDPKVNVWGAGIDFVHDECALAETDADYQYLTDTTTFPYDVNFYVVKSYYYTDNGDLKSEGLPAILLSSGTKVCKLGVGVAFFDSLSLITEEMISQLVTDPVIDYGVFKNDSTGFYEKEALSAALAKCVIGERFRSNLLDIPQDKTEQDVQAVYLLETAEGAYVKFMVKEFKPAKPNEKQTLVRWQVISE